MKFQRIQDLRNDNDISIKKISVDLGLHRDVYSRYEKGVRDFPIDILIKIANGGPDGGLKREPTNCDFLISLSALRLMCFWLFIFGLLSRKRTNNPFSLTVIE